MHRRWKWFVLVALGAALMMLTGCAKSSGTNCGNGRIDEGEQCDGADLGYQDCASLGFGIGVVKCTPSCVFDTTACSNFSQCGNGLIEGSENCDGVDLGGQTCDTLNLGGGTLGCNPADCTFNTSGCTNASDCGNGVVEGPEQCDGANLNGGSCLGEGYTGGTLGCDVNSCLYDVSGCTNTGPVCGNGTLEAGEECDGSDFGGLSCADLPNFAGGSLSCTTSCVRDTSGCSNTAEDCTNGVDDDGDLAVDCNDLDCSSHASCGGSPENCTNGVDDDQDGYIDCDDLADCSSDPSCQTTSGEICNNGVDDDGLFGCDCGDLFCLLDFSCLLAPTEESNCSDGQDDDQDCDVDCADSDCANDPACSSAPVCTSAAAIACGDSPTGDNSTGTSVLDNWGSWCGTSINATGPELYYVYTASTSGSVTAELTFDSGTVDLELFVVGESGGDCDPINACMDAGQTASSPESVTFNATSGTTYYIFVDGYQSSDTGAFTLSLSCS